MVRWGILSTAKIARDHVIPALLNAEGCVISAIASRTEDKAKSVAERFAIPHVFDSYDALLASDLVDAVYIPLPTSQHVEWSIKAARAGKHVLCEKPIALTAGDINEIVSAAAENKVIVSEAFMVTYHPQWHKVRSLISEGAIGQLKHVNGIFTYHNVDPDNMRNQLDLGGGALPDIGCYPVVTTRFATGSEPTRVSAKIFRDPTFGTDIYANTRIEFETFDLTMYVSTQMALQQSMRFHGDKGCIVVHAPFNAGGYDAEVVTLENRDRSKIENYRFSGTNQYQLQVEAFARAIKSKDPTAELFSLEHSICNQRVLDALYKSDESSDWEDV